MPTRAPDLDGPAGRPGCRSGRGGFLALLAARRAPRTVDAYRRDLADLPAFSAAPDERERATTSRAGSPTCAAAARHRARSRAGPPRPAPSTAISSRSGSGRQPGRRRRPPAAAHEAPALALARRGRAPDRRRQRRHAPQPARPGPRRAPLRRRAPRERGGRAGARRRRPREPRSCAAWGRATRNASSRSGSEAVEALRRYLARGRPYLDRRHRPELFLNAQGGGAHPRRRVPDRPPAGREGRARPGAHPPAPPPALVRHPPARGGCRPTQRPGDARARRPRDDRDLHACFGPAAARYVLQGAPACARGRAGAIVESISPDLFGTLALGGGLGVLLVSWPSGTRCSSSAERRAARRAASFAAAAPAAVTGS